MCPRPADPAMKENLVRAARAEFARQGIDRARVEDIAHKAGTSKGSFYLHFESKDSAFREIIERFVEVLETQAARRQELQDRFLAEKGPLTGADIQGRTALFSEAMALDLQCDIEVLETLWQHREILAALETAAGEPYREILAGFEKRMGEAIALDIAARKATGHLRQDLDPVAVSDLILGAYDALSRRMPGMVQKPDLARWANTVVSILWEGMLPRDGDSTVCRSMTARVASSGKEIRDP